MTGLSFVTAVVVVAAGAVFAMICALLVRVAFQAGQAPTWLLAAAAIVVAVPCVLVGYQIAREREIEPHRGRALIVRCLIRRLDSSTSLQFP